MHVMHPARIYVNRNCDIPCPVGARPYNNALEDFVRLQHEKQLIAINYEQALSCFRSSTLLVLNHPLR